MTSTEKMVRILRNMKKEGMTLDDLAEFIQKVESLNPNVGGPTEITEPASPEIKDDESLEQKITNLMHEVGIPAHLKGHAYVRRSIEMICENPDLINAVTKELYPMVAEEFATTPFSVERTIRRAIEVAWERGNIEVLKKYFGYTVSPIKGKPTNSEFIAMLADTLRMKYKM